MINLLDDMNVSDIQVNCFTSNNNTTIKFNHVITVEQIYFTINKSKTNKSDRTDGLLSDHV